MKQFMKRSIAMKAIGLSLALLIVLAVAWQRPRVVRAVGPTVTLTPFSGGFTTPIGLDVYEPTGELIASANYPTGSPFNLNLIHADGTHTQYSSLSGLTNELKIATVRSSPCLGGFVVGDLFTGNGVPGQIVKVNAGGGVVLNPWTTLPGETALVRGSLVQDRACNFGGDLIVVTGNEQTDADGQNGGRVYRVNSAGVATRIAELPLAGGQIHLEGVVSVPNIPAKYGPAAGRVLVGAEDLLNPAPGQLSYGPNGRIYGIGPSGVLNGNVITIGATDGIPGRLNFPTPPIHVEDIDLMRRNATFYGAAFNQGQILTAPASDFAAFCDDILLTEELPSGHFPNVPAAPGVSGLKVLQWNAGTMQFDVTPLATSDPNQVIPQWEHVTFLTGIDCAVNNCSLRITKQCATAANPIFSDTCLVAPGSNVMFRFTLENLGAAVTNVNLQDTDPRLGIIAALINLAAGETRVFNKTITITEPFTSTTNVTGLVGGATCAATSTLTVNTTGGAHGCTPGFWKNHATNPPWGSYTPSQKVNTVFTIPACIPSKTTFDNESLLDALQGGGGTGLDGKAAILLRAATAAVLNADNGNPPYPLSVAQIIFQTNAALASCDEDKITKLGDTLDKSNNKCDKP